MGIFGYVGTDITDITIMRVGADLGGTKVEVVIVDDKNNVCWRQRRTTAQLKNGNLEAAYQDTLNIVADLMDDAAQAVPFIKKLPLGMGTPGAECADGRLKNCNSVWLNGRYFRLDLESRLQRPVRLANDANCFALAEAHMGAAQGAKSVFGVIMGTGVGGGLVLDGKLHTGTNGIAGEWGHNRMPDALAESERAVIEIAEPLQQRRCYCGRNNCVETFLSGPGLSNSYFLATGRRNSAEEIVANIEKGDSTALVVWQHYIQQLARALAQVINIVDPEVIVLGGGMSNVEAIYQQLPQFWSPYIFSNDIRTRLARAHCGDSAGVFGAAWLW